MEKSSERDRKRIEEVESRRREKEKRVKRVT
jgi:hypothetical protein